MEGKKRTGMGGRKRKGGTQGTNVKKRGGGKVKTILAINNRSGKIRKKPNGTI